MFMVLKEDIQNLMFKCEKILDATEIKVVYQGGNSMMEFLQFHISKILVDILLYLLGVIALTIFFKILFKKDK